jgi:hypothetical protein
MNPEELAKVKQDPNYIGATNFSSLQKQYSPYQLSQATTKDAYGNYFWNPAVNIASVPTAEPLKSPGTTTPPPASSMSGSSPTLTAPPTAGPADYQARNEAAKTYLTGIQKTIDDLNANREATLTKEKDEQTKTVKSLTDKLSSFFGSTKSEDALTRDRNLFDVQGQIQTLSSIQSKIADATAALDQGIIYEQGRPTRMSLLVGRVAQLQQQGNAKISALTAAAEVVKGNIDLARAYADDSQSAILNDITTQKDAIKTVLDLEEKKLISLEDDEREVIDSRMKSLDEQAAQVQKDKDSVFTLATNHPDAFVKGNVTFMDSVESAIAKMTPYLAEKDQLEIQKMKADIAATGRSNAGGGSGSGSLLSAFDANMQEGINLAFQNGVTLDQFIKDAGGPTQFTKKQLDSLQDFWSTYQKAPKTVTASDLKNNYGIDPTQNPEYIGLTEEELQKKLQAKKSDEVADAAQKGVWWNPFTWGGS